MSACRWCVAQKEMGGSACDGEQGRAEGRRECEGEDRRRTEGKKGEKEVREEAQTMGVCWGRRA